MSTVAYRVLSCPIVPTVAYRVRPAEAEEDDDDGR